MYIKIQFIIKTQKVDYILIHISLLFDYQFYDYHINEL